MYVTEKLRINKNTKTKKLFDLDDYYLLVHKIIINKSISSSPELRVFVENVLIIKHYDTINQKITVEPKGWGKEFKSHYEIINDRIVLCNDIDSLDKSTLLHKDEAIEFLKDLKKNDYCIDLKEYFGEKDGKVAVSNDGEEHRIKDEEIKDKIDELKTEYYDISEKLSINKDTKVNEYDHLVEIFEKIIGIYNSPYKEEVNNYFKEWLEEYDVTDFKFYFPNQDDYDFFDNFYNKDDDLSKEAKEKYEGIDTDHCNDINFKIHWGMYEKKLEKLSKRRKIYCNKYGFEYMAKEKDSQIAWNMIIFEKNDD